MSESDPERTTIRMRRRSAQSLPNLNIPQRDCSESDLQVYDKSLLTRKDSQQHNYNPVQEEGRELFEHFLHDELVNKGIDAPANSFTPIITTPYGYANPMWAKTGRELQCMADSFAKTKERLKVKTEADKVSILDVTYDKFHDLLSELFFGEGVTKERILVLFFFCSDVAIRCLREDPTFDVFHKFLSWIIHYITKHVCDWVQRHGGWGAILYRGSVNITQSFVVVGACLVTGYAVYRVARHFINS